MSPSDRLSLLSIIITAVVGIVAIVIALVIYHRQTGQSARQLELIGKLNELGALQKKQTESLANLELREKFGTISSRAERLAGVRGKTLQDLEMSSVGANDETEILEWRAQIMYTIYDCLAVDHVYADADPDIQEQFRAMMHGYDDTWAQIPVLHGDRKELNVPISDSLLTLFKCRLKAYQ
jgi:hypothetical protein